MPEAIQDLAAVKMPQNLEAERALLGCLILDNSRLDTVKDVFPSSVILQAMTRQPLRRGVPAQEPVFFSASHQIIFGAICALSETNREITLVTLAEELLQRGQLDSVGGSPYLGQLEDDIFSLGQVAELARIVLEKWRLRCLVRAAIAISNEAAHSDAPAEEIIDRAEKQIFDIALERRQGDFEQVGVIVTDLMIEIEQRAKGLAGMPGLATGFPKFDQKTSGLRKADLVIIAARPSMGKTSFAMNIAANVALHKGRPVGIFSLEMSKQSLMMRMMCTEAHVSMTRVYGGQVLRRDELEKMREVADRVHNAPLHVDDATSLSTLELRARGRRLKARCPDLALIVVDYLQLMRGGASRHDNRTQEVSEISRALKGLARELEIPVIALSQLSRQVEQRRGKEDKLPRLSDLRESGAIEQDADVVVFIHRDRNMDIDETNAHEPELATVHIAKQRNGETGRFNMLFRGEFTQFVDITRG